jgi:hypothetical protein
VVSQQQEAPKLVKGLYWEPFQLLVTIVVVEDQDLEKAKKRYILNFE